MSSSKIYKFDNNFNKTLLFMYNSVYNFLLFIFILSLTISCESETTEEGLADMKAIEERERIKAITSYSPFSYFIYQGQPMGYEYELLQMLGSYLDMPVDIIVARDFQNMEEMLKNGKGDLIAYNLTITSERRERLAFTDPMNVTRQMLVQRKPGNWRDMKLHQIEARLISSPFELKDKTIHVRRGSAYTSRLRNLSDEIGHDINIVEASAHVTTEDLIRLVAEDSIDYTVSDENIARVQAAYYNNINIEMPISLHQQTAWAVRPSSTLLLESINEWLEEAKKEADYHVVYNKYYKDRHEFIARYTSDFFPITGDAISPYDDMLREGADMLGWDWRLLAALTYRESKFDPLAQSWAGAVGLMQLMPRTAREFGAEDPYNPEQNIKAGINFLLWLEEYWADKIEDEQERKKFIIASYNVGQGHIQDARRLAEAFDADPDVWDNNVEHYIIKKSNPDYYSMDIVNYGYANGLEPVNYVESIFSLHEHYKQFVD